FAPLCCWLQLDTYGRVRVRACALLWLRRSCCRFGTGLHEQLCRHLIVLWEPLGSRMARAHGHISPPSGCQRGILTDLQASKEGAGMDAAHRSALWSSLRKMDRPGVFSRWQS